MLGARPKMRRPRAEALIGGARNGLLACQQIEQGDRAETPQRAETGQRAPEKLPARTGLRLRTPFFAHGSSLFPCKELIEVEDDAGDGRPRGKFGVRRRGRGVAARGGARGGARGSARSVAHGAAGFGVALELLPRKGEEIDQ